MPTVALPPRVRRSTAAPETPSRPSPSPEQVSRRAVLRGVAGSMLALPLLESSTEASAGDPAHHAVFVRQANGISTATLDGSEPDRFWPRSYGALTRTSLSVSDADRAVSELSAYAERLLMVRRTGFAFREPGSGCQHPVGWCQLLTAAAVEGYPDTVRDTSRALGESIDSYIARHHPNNGGEPLTLYAGRESRGAREVLSFRGPGDLRPAEDSPWTAYTRMVGGGAVSKVLTSRRLSINDLVRDQMATLMADPRLSGSDLDRLDLHFQSVRDFEVDCAAIEAASAAAMADIDGRHNLDETRLEVARLHCELIAWACSCDLVRAATLQIGSGKDLSEYTIDGVQMPSFHMISHRLWSEDFSGEPMEGASEMHHSIDRAHLQVFRHLLDKLDQYGILDQSIAVFTSEHGTRHALIGQPWVIAGAGDGLLAQGQVIEAKETVHNHLLSTLISATGIRKADGGLVDDFGDPDLAPGVITAMLA